jgi:ATP-dependent DNA helicase 2 subunit 2
LTSTLKNGIVGTCALALREIARPDIKVTKSVLMGTVLRLGDVDVRLDEAFEVAVKTSKCTALTRPKGWKKFARRVDLREGAKEADDSMDVDEDRRTIYAQLQMRTEYFIDKSLGHEDEDEMKVEEDAEEALPKADNMEKVEKEQLVRGFKYGATYAPCPEGQFPRLETRKGIDILGFFRAEDVSASQASWHDQP